jgi:hypothetical protein
MFHPSQQPLFVKKNEKTQQVLVEIPVCSKDEETGSSKISKMATLI